MSMQGPGAPPVVRRTADAARLVPRRLRERPFWVIQAWVVGITVVHGIAEGGMWGIAPPLDTGLHHIPIALYIIPIVYGGLKYGYEGEVLTGLWCGLLTIPNLVIWHRHDWAWVSEIAFVLMMIGVGFAVAYPVEREKRQRERAEATSRTLALLNEMAMALAQSPDIDRTLDSVLGRLADVMGFESICIAVGGGAAPTRFIQCRRERRDACRTLDRALATGMVSGIEPVPLGNGVVAVPLAVEKGIQAGALGVFTDRALTAEDTEILKAVASQIGVAIENARLHQEEKARLHSYVQHVTRAQEEERKRIARELHDEVAQSLVLVCRRLDALVEETSPVPERALEDLGELRELAEGSLESLRRFGRDLRPAMLDDLGLVPSLEWLASDLGRRTGIAVDLATSGAPRRLAGETEVALFRIVQEALRNVERHARASRVSVETSFENGEIRLGVGDDGMGFSLPVTPDGFVPLGKLGVVGMRERAELVGGTFAISSEPGRGTRVSVRVAG